MTELGAALCIYWAVVLALLSEVHRELGDPRGARDRGLTVLLHAVLALAVVSAVVLTATWLYRVAG